MNCHCLGKINENLRSQNLRLTGYAFELPAFRLVPPMATAWLNLAKVPRSQRKTTPAMFASHCPFCGKPVKKKTLAKGAR
jgi:hypothetical protein